MTERTYSLTEIYPLQLLALCVWREARGETQDAKRGVAWAIRNRVQHPSWWGIDWVSVILKPKQFSSFNHDDPNATKFPTLADTSWAASLAAAAEAFDGTGPDPVAGADHYYDDSIAKPAWAEGKTLTTKLGKLNFYK